MKTFKKVLASALAAAMVVTAFPVTNAEAATAPKLSATKATLYVGQSKKITVKNLTGTWKGAKVVSYRSNKNVTLSRTGSTITVKAVKAGTAKVTVTVTPKNKKVKAKKLTANITVQEPSIAFTDSVSEVVVGTTETVAATATPEATVKYYSADKSIATVGVTSGVVTGVKEGTVKIAAKFYTGSKENKVYKEINVVSALAAKQTGAKQITLTLGKAVSEAPAVTVKKGAVTVSLATKDGVVLSSDGKTIVLNTNSALTADKYTITVGDNTVELTAVPSAVDTIAVLSDKFVLSTAPVNPVAISAGAIATAAYQVKNQFGEDITKGLTINCGNSAVGAANGVLTYTVPSGVTNKVGDAIPVVLYDNTGKSTSAVLTLSNASTVAEVSFAGVYNKDNKTLSEDTNLAVDKFYVLIDAKDQYGNTVAANGTRSDIVLNAPTGTGLTRTTVSATYEKITVNGKDYLGARITGSAKAGTELVVAIATSTGKSATTSYEVANGAKVATFSVVAPELVVGGEKTYFDFSAADTYGNPVTDATVLSNMTINSTIGSFAFEKGKDGKAVLAYAPGTIAADTPVSVLFITQTNQTANLTFTVKKDAVATAITGVKDAALAAMNVASNTVTIKPENIVVEDQYGRAMKAADVKKAITATTTADVANQLFTATTSTTGTSNSANLTFAVKASKDAGTETFTLAIAGVQNSDYTVTLSTVAQSSIKSYEIADIATVYTDGTHATSGAYVRSLTVNGVLADGSKVVVPSSEYSVIPSANIECTSSGAITAKAGLADTNGALEKVNDATEKITVIINATAEEITKDVKISKAAPVVASAKLDNVEDITVADVVSLTTIVATGKIKVTDQYGVETALTTTGARLSITDVTDVANVTVAKNGTSDASATANSGAHTATAKITFASGYTFTFKVNFSK